ncbi:MAG: exodeoxyribonuclease VII large subunit [Rhodobacter sp.]|uniref:exodeoxyribonuclease VII large subunit n=1 Tax=Pararhodobacter sp. TaxID=2127056 RepID=UPI002C9A2C7E|nr:exodeoxyribonuclease VII large subunit [Pararhodobacter sp.]MCC0072821.1 exodeoxyribonuclease VII large subunit [Rhodobacter sp.]HPD90929.1 exodeoxyribonuclease VII large subunit [Pararhodobacter sp.]
MDLIDDDLPGPGGNAHEFTVSDLSGAVKRALEGEFGRVRVRGEVGRVMVARTGHMYFDLKDDRAVIAAVSWKGQVARMAIRPEEGMEVIATGRLTTYAPQSKYQLQVDNVEPAGAGALMAMLEARRKALAAEGLFDAGNKRPIPYLPQVIGVITSPSGAVIRDILHRLADRFPRRVIVWPVAVQGERCPAEVVRAIKGFNAIAPGGPVPRPDVLIVARGGGSIEDLWGFNDEAVVRAAAASEIPLISAVGHETDTTLIDHAADLRAPTPTAAAELAVPVRADLLAHVATLGARLHRAATGAVQAREQRLRDLSRALPRAEALLATPTQRFDRVSDRFAGSLKALAQRKALDLNRAAAGLRPGVLRHRLEQRADRLAAGAGRLAPALAAGLARKGDRLAALRLPQGQLVRDLARAAERLEARGQRMRPALLADLARRRDRLDALGRMHGSLGYEQTLARGYAVVRDADGRPLTDAEAVRALAQFTVQMRDGTLDAMPLAASPRPRKKPTEPGPGQGSLF